MERFSDKYKLPKNNLTNTGKYAVECFSKRKYLVITKAGKGATVIPDVKYYIAKANENLQDDSFLNYYIAKANENLQDDSFLSKTKCESYCQTFGSCQQ